MIGVGGRKKKPRQRDATHLFVQLAAFHGEHGGGGGRPDSAGKFGQSESLGRWPVLFTLLQEREEKWEFGRRRLVGDKVYDANETRETYESCTAKERRGWEREGVGCHDERKKQRRKG